MKIPIFLLLIALPLIGMAQRKGDYTTQLISVEVQGKQTADSTMIKIDSITNLRNKHYLYADSAIDITWYFGYTKFYFELKNKRSETIKIIWDDAAYIDPSGETNKIFHSGVKYIDRNNSQPPTTIIKDSKLSDIVSPTDNVYYSSGSYGGWNQNPLFPTSIKIDTPILKNKIVRVLLPISYGNTVKEYIFYFKILWEEENKKKK